MSAPGNVRAAAVSRDDWRTPLELFAALNKEFHFTLDMAASKDNTLCNMWCEQAFKCDAAFWRARHVAFCNPPYGTWLLNWAKLFGLVSPLGTTVVALVPDNTETEWFRECYGTAWEERRLRRRVQFRHPETGEVMKNSPGGSVLFVWRPGVRPYAAPAVSYWDWR